MLMNGDECGAIAIEKDVLGPIAVVDIKIVDGDFFAPVASASSAAIAMLLK